MKSIGLGLMAAIVLSFGYSLERQKRAALQDLEDFNLFMKYLSQEMLMRGSALAAGIGQILPLCRGRSVSFGRQLLLLLKDGQQAGGLAALWQEAAAAVYRGSAFTVQEREVLMLAGEGITLPRRSMIAGQQELLAKRLEDCIRQRKETLHTDSRLCRVLSFSAAAFLVIVLW